MNADRATARVSDSAVSSIANGSENGRTQPGWQLARQTAYWAALLIGIAGSSWLSKHGLFFAGVPPVPVRVNPALLLLGVLMAVAVLAILSPGHRNRRPVGVKRGACVISMSALALGAILSALHPGLGASVARDSLAPVEGQAAVRSFGFAVFFGNGAPAASSVEQRRLQDAFAVFRHCEAGTLRVRGFASSAPFQGHSLDQSREMNRILANRRAVVTRDALARLVRVTGEAVEWTTYEEMVSQRRLRDVDLEGKRLAEVEELNRRAEVFWNDSSCAGTDVRR